MDLTPLTTKIGKRDEILREMKAKFTSPDRMFVYYNSALDLIIEDVDLMVLPLEDRQFHRGHGICDAFKIIGDRVIGFADHMDRLEEGAALCKIPLPMPMEVIRRKALETAYVAYQKNLREHKEKIIHCRMWLSSGLGAGFAISGAQAKAIFYCVMYLGSELNPKILEGVKEKTIWELPSRPDTLTRAKTSNYLINTLVALKAIEVGGFIGIQLDHNGYITEGSIRNVLFLWDTDEIVLPHWTNILKGRTLTRVLKFIEDEMMGPKGKIKGIVFRDIKPVDVYEHAKEMIFTSYEIPIPILEYDGRRIGDGKKGPLAEYLQKRLTKWATEECPTIQDLMGRTPAKL